MYDNEMGVPEYKIKDERNPSIQCLRYRLLYALTHSQAYSTERMLIQMPMDLMEERVVLYCKLRQHHLVLQLYLEELNDMDLAEAYCLEQAVQNQRQSLSQNGMKANDVFLMLLRLYLDPCHSPERAIQLCNVYGQYIVQKQMAFDLLLSQMSSHVSIADIQPFLGHIFQHETSRLRQTEISKHLRHTEWMQTQLEYYRELQQYPGFVFKNSAEQVCSHCHQPVGCVFQVHFGMRKSKQPVMCHFPSCPP